MFNSGGKKINILTLVLSENKFLNEKNPITPPPPPPSPHTHTHTHPLQVKWSVPNDTQYLYTLFVLT